MSLFLLSEIESLPKSKGVFYFLNEENQTLFVGVAENLKREICLLSAKNHFLLKETRAIETINSIKQNLIKTYAEVIRQRKPLYNFNLNEQRHFPHLKITNEKFPRLLVTRKIENDQADYFGAFLPETGVRLLLDFLNKLFRLRSCTIKVDGDFSVPCTQFYEKRCVAPCVKSLCNKAEYYEMVSLLRLFLQNKRTDLINFLTQRIELLAEGLAFEMAGNWRDILQNIQNIWNKKDWNFWLEDAVDSFEAEEKDNQVFIYYVSQRGRKILGKRGFVFDKKEGFDKKDVFSQIIWQLYEFYAPKEIRVSTDFPNRKFLSKVLSLREARKLKISVVTKNKKITTERAFGRTKFEFDFRQIKPTKSFEEIQNELQKEFGLKKKPERIEAFDVAHISETNFVAAKSIWESGKFLINEYEFWLLAEKSELETLEKGIFKRFETQNKLPDLILIDGGKPQLNAALKAIENLKNRKFSIIAAVKPAGKHNQVSHFITENGNIIKMKPESDVLQMLVRLRDETHDLANRVHRQRRDTSLFYEVAAILPSINERERRFLLQKYGSLKRLKSTNKNNLIKVIGTEKAEIAFKDLQNDAESYRIEPLIVPIRFDDKNGDARDLQPLSNMRSN